jgi:hypothetical protein
LMVQFYQQENQRATPILDSYKIASAWTDRHNDGNLYEDKKFVQLGELDGRFSTLRLAPLPPSDAKTQPRLWPEPRGYDLLLDPDNKNFAKLKVKSANPTNDTSPLEEQDGRQQQRGSDASYSEDLDLDQAAALNLSVGSSQVVTSAPTSGKRRRWWKRRKSQAAANETDLSAYDFMDTADALDAVDAADTTSSAATVPAATNGGASSGRRRMRLWRRKDKAAANGGAGGIDLSAYESGTTKTNRTTINNQPHEKQSTTTTTPTIAITTSGRTPPSSLSNIRLLVSPLSKEAPDPSPDPSLLTGGSTKSETAHDQAMVPRSKAHSSNHSLQQRSKAHSLAPQGKSNADQLLKYYKKHDEPRATRANVRKVLLTFEVDKLKAELLAKYGEAPSLSPGVVDKLLAYYRKHDDSKATIINVRKVLWDFELPQLEAALHAKYGEAPALEDANGGASPRGTYDVMLEGQEEGDGGHTMMGVYETFPRAYKDVNTKGVWQALGGVDRFLYYCSSNEQWVIGEKSAMEAGAGIGLMMVDSTAAAPELITDEWRVSDEADWRDAPKLRVRVCSFLEKQVELQRVEGEQADALAQAEESRTLLVEGLEDDRNGMMGVYNLMHGKVVSGRAVWQSSDGGTERFLFYASTNEWYVGSDRAGMEQGHDKGWMLLTTTALTPDRARPSEVWRVDDGADWVPTTAVRVRRQDNGSRISSAPS